MNQVNDKFYCFGKTIKQKIKLPLNYYLKNIDRINVFVASHNVDVTIIIRYESADVLKEFIHQLDNDDILVNITWIIGSDVDLFKIYDVLKNIYAISPTSSKSKILLYFKAWHNFHLLEALLEIIKNDKNAILEGLDIYANFFLKLDKDECIILAKNLKFLSFTINSEDEYCNDIWDNCNNNFLKYATKMIYFRFANLCHRPAYNKILEKLTYITNVQELRIKLCYITEMEYIQPTSFTSKKLNFPNLKTLGLYIVDNHNDFFGYSPNPFYSEYQNLIDTYNYSIIKEIFNAPSLTFTHSDIVIKQNCSLEILQLKCNKHVNVNIEVLHLLNKEYKIRNLVTLYIPNLKELLIKVNEVNYLQISYLK